MKNPKLIINYAVFFIALGSFFYNKEFYLKKQEQLESRTIESTEESLNNVTNEESTTIYSVCWKEFYPNGKIKIEGVLDNYRKEYDINGKLLKTSDTYKSL